MKPNTIDLEYCRSLNSVFSPVVIPILDYIYVDIVELLFMIYHITKRLVY